MKKFLLSITAVLFLISASEVSAQTVSQAELLKQIQVLTEIIEGLKQLAEKKSIVTPPPSAFVVPPAGEVVGEKGAELDSFPKAENPWSARFATSQVPKNSYQAYYFNTKKPNTVVTKAKMPQVAISNALNDGGTLKISPEDFGGYWVGNIEIATDGNYEVSTAESWSESRVIINGKEVKTEGEEAVLLYLKKGTYKVEVEFVNNWHTTDFAMNILPQYQKYSASELKEALSQYTDAKNWYVGVYETGNANRRLDVNATSMSEDSILFLSTYSQLQWVLAANKHVKAIVVSSYEPGTVVSGVPKGVPVFYVEADVIAGEYTLEEGCDTYKGISFSACEYIDQLSKIDTSLVAITGKEADTFTGGYGPFFLKAPGKVITKSVREKIEQSYADARREAAEEAESQSLENIF